MKKHSNCRKIKNWAPTIVLYAFDAARVSNDNKLSIRKL